MSTYLHKAAQQNRIDIVKWLIDNGAKANSKDRMHKTALHIASENNYPEVVKLLIQDHRNQDGALTDLRDKDGYNSLDYALINNSSLEVVKWLLKELKHQGI